MTDKQLIQEIASGNHQAFTDIYNRYRSEFINFIRKGYTCTDDTIFDLYQDSCVALYDNICQGRLTASNLTVHLKTYLFSIGRKKLVDHIRRTQTKKHIGFIDNIMPDADFNTEYFDECSERNAIIMQAVNEMTEPCSSILLLYYWDDMSCSDIASQQGYSNADSAKTQKSKCMKKLKLYIKQIL